MAFAKALASLFEVRRSSSSKLAEVLGLPVGLRGGFRASCRSSQKQRFWVYPLAFAKTCISLRCFPRSFLASKLLECLGSGNFLASKLLEWLRSGTLEAPEAAICEASYACAAAWKPLGAGSYVICEATLAGALDLRVGLHEDLCVSLRN